MKQEDQAGLHTGRMYHQKMMEVKFRKRDWIKRLDYAQ